MKRILFLVMAMVSVPALGQSTDEAKPRETTVEVASAEDAVEAIRERIRRAVRLPRTAEDSREEGVSDERVRDTLKTARDRQIPAGDVQEILEAENEAIRAGGDKNNFGAAVQRAKDSGLRGRELAAAIHAEQIARGMKKPKTRDHGGDRDKAKPKSKGKARKGSNK